MCSREVQFCHSTRLHALAISFSMNLKSPDSKENYYQFNINYYTIYNEKYFQEVSFCVITHPIGQNGRAVYKKHGNHGDARDAKHLVLELARMLGAAGRIAH